MPQYKTSQTDRRQTTHRAKGSTNSTVGQKNGQIRASFALLKDKMLQLQETSAPPDPRGSAWSDPWHSGIALSSESFISCITAVGRAHVTRLSFGDRFPVVMLTQRDNAESKSS